VRSHEGKIDGYELKSFLRIKHGLKRQFTLVAAAALVVAMMVLGTWVSKKIETGVSEIAGASAALYINTFLTPHLQELADGDTLSEASIQALNEALVQPAVRAHVLKIKIWKQDGHIVYSSDRDLVGKRFPPSPHQLAAWSGAVGTEVDHLYHEENEGERSISIPMLEVYAPVRDIRSGEVIAVLEFYEDAQALKEQLSHAHWQSWAVTALVAIAIIGALFSIVSEGSKAIDHMRGSLSHRIMQLKELLRQNEVLRARVERSGRDRTDGNADFMPRVALNLRDGPGQSISLALVQLNTLDRQFPTGAELPAVRDALSKALCDIWDICAGLQLPEVKNLSPADAMQKIVSDHGDRSRMTVDCRIDIPAPCTIPDFIKICASRFVQVCLDSTDRDDTIRSAFVSARSDSDALHVVVTADAPASGDLESVENALHLGLSGLWDQIESIGGTIAVEAEANERIRLMAWMPLARNGSRQM
jgi:signal transduction histidine kinase